VFITEQLNTSHHIINAQKMHVLTGHQGTGIVHGLRLHPRGGRTQDDQGRECVVEGSTAQTSVWKCSTRPPKTASSTHDVILHSDSITVSPPFFYEGRWACPCDTMGSTSPILYECHGSQGESLISNLRLDATPDTN